MAKADFCFTFYDGDAAREMAHMNRLERGGYMDLIIQQRQRGHLSVDFIKKILGKDFESVWSAIEITLIKDEEGNYFIEWLENSEIKAKKQSRHQSENGKKGGRGNKKESETKPIQSQIKPNESKIKPLGDGDGDENEIVFGNTEKGGVGEKTIIGEVIEQWQQSGLTVDTSEAKDIRELCEKILNIKDISQADEQKRHELLGVMQKIISWVKSENNIKYYGSLKSINNNFSKIINSLKNGTKQTKRTGEGSSPDELAEIVRRRFSDKQKV